MPHKNIAFLKTVVFFPIIHPKDFIRTYYLNIKTHNKLSLFFSGRPLKLSVVKLNYLNIRVHTEIFDV